MGPLNGIRVLELAGMPPTSFAAMLLADLGAEVFRVDRPGAAAGDPGLRRGRAGTIDIDLKRDGATEVLLRLVEHTDVLVESFRPGVCERLGIGPGDCHARNPRLIYGRLTGWGQDGPYAMRPGHDINYIGVSGVLATFGAPEEPPAPPLNLVGNLAGGAVTFALGVSAALFERERSGHGQVVDAAMLDGAAQLSAGLHAARAAGRWIDRRCANITDGAAPFYRTYRTADDSYVAVGAVEPAFYAALLKLLDLPDEQGDQFDRASWPARAERFAARFASRTRQQWCDDPGSVDACVTPVLTPAEAPNDPHNAARAVLLSDGDVVRPAAAPRFSRSIAEPAGDGRSGSAEVLGGFGFSADEVDALHAAGVLG